MNTIFKRLLIVLCLAPIFAMLVSCARPGLTQNTVAIVGRVPVIDMSVKPQLENMDADELVAYNSLPESLRKKLQSNDRKLKVYAEQMSIAILDYNAYAAARNKTSDEAVGIKGAKK